MTDVRGGVYPFCRACTTTSTAWRAPDSITRLSGIGNRFYGHVDVCPDCGSSVRTLYSTFLLIPVARRGRFRIIKTGGRSYVGRRLLDRPAAVPASLSQEPPASEFKDHPELVDATYEQAEAHWAARDSAGALPLYETSLAACEKVLKADDPATLQVRLRVAQVLLATGDYASAIGWFELITPQLIRVFGSGHDLTRIAVEGETGAQLMVGGPRAEMKVLTELLDQDEKTLGGQHPKVLRTRAALGRATMFAGQLGAGVQVLELTLADGIEGLGADHPDTEIFRGMLLEACDAADNHGKKKDRELSAAARDRWTLAPKAD
ncbi:tetratricopeptide repeat protein [Streptomyces sp. SID13031]|uniref:tetratricopeptide repeat protein n=1 Tax=Streptomyces sp. SID13031 TaxID=2706046 RepID=UPI0013C62F20|nr:tetratricopeptide repeat protein [Streptomyces sp. SID13031]NEA32627.1 tetratricopeptide repeat protein [Streptomyces sp. SID13031]